MTSRPLTKWRSEGEGNMWRPRTRTRTLLIAATGAALSLLLGSGLLALVSDSVTSQGNEFSSGAFGAAPSHDVKAALISSGLGSLCITSTPLQDGPIAAAISGQTLDLSLGTLGQTNDFCVRNDGTSTGRLRVSLASIVGTELGACESSENTAGDTTCGAGAAGELAPALVWSFVRTDPDVSASCISSSSAPFDGISSRIVDTDLAPGDTCRVSMRVLVPASTTETQKLLAQTDRLQFDVVFTLEDITVP
jgi:hypothetical protein